jgi:glycosyltransferase involved in cell wall biosynthesis
MRVGIDARKIADFGIGTYIRGLLRGVLSLGLDDVDLVGFAPDDQHLPDGVQHVPLDVPHYALREPWLVGRRAEQAGLDVFHAPHYVIPVTPLPVVVTIHDLIHLHQPMRNPLAPLYARTMIRRAMRESVAVLTVSNAVRNDLVTFGCDPAKIIVAWNGVDPTQPTDDDSRTAGQFLFVGNDKPHKNVETLVAAFALVRKELPASTLTLAGGEFSRFARERGVQVAGFVSDTTLDALYRSATALIAPSREEGFGLPVAEAMARGTAVITSNAAALVEVSGDAGLHVGADDVRGFADAMLRVAGDRQLRTTLAARGVVRAREFSWRRCAEETVRAWQKAWNIVERRV